MTQPWKFIASDLRKSLKAKKVTAYQVAIFAEKKFGVSFSSTYRALRGASGVSHKTSLAIVESVNKITGVKSCKN